MNTQKEVAGTYTYILSSGYVPLNQKIVLFVGYTNKRQIFYWKLIEKHSVYLFFS